MSTEYKYCCKEMQHRLVDGEYEDEYIHIIMSNDGHYMSYDKKTNDTLPLGECMWCGAQLD